MRKIFHFITILTIFSLIVSCSERSSDENQGDVISENEMAVENIDTTSELEDEPNIGEEVDIEPILENEEAKKSPQTKSEQNKSASSIAKSKKTTSSSQPKKSSGVFSKQEQEQEQEQPTSSEPKSETKNIPSSDNNEQETITKSKPKTPKTTVALKPDLSHDIWNNLLQKYVSSAGKVNYAGIKKEQKKLEEYLNILALNPPQSDWSRNKQIAYWINAYNAHTVDLIVKNYPISSILKLDGGKTWYVKRIEIGKKAYSLDEIEKQILIGKFKEPRVHFAVNCAAKSCPPLMNKAFEASSLQSDLERLTRNFINDNNNNSFSKRSAKLSKIFDWYAADFGDLNAFINKYAPKDISSKTKITYNDYNWDLNE